MEISVQLSCAYIGVSSKPRKKEKKNPKSNIILTNNEKTI